jgi:toxin ParE1/3/4
VHFELIAKNPQSFESVDFIKPGYRRCVCGVDSIFYKINGDGVDIMAIFGRLDLNQLL